MMENPWQIKSSRLAYDNSWISVTEHEVIKPNGADGIYGVVKFKNKAIAILPLDEDYNTWIVGQYRFPTNTYEWEVPEGGSPEGESPEETACRELFEETGLLAEEFIPVHEFQLSNSTTTEIGFAFVARDLTLREAEPDDDEVLQVRKIPFADLLEMVMRGEIRDCLSVATILKVHLMIEKGII